MSEYDYETSWIFRKPNHFWVELNKQMIIKDRDTLNNGGLYHLLLFSSAPTDFNDWINNRGCLNNTTYLIDDIDDVSFHLGVEWLDNGENGFKLFIDEWEDNADPTSEKIDVNIPITEDTEINVKAIAIAKVTGSDTGSDYIVAYSVLSTRNKCQNYITIQKGSSIVGHSSCKEVS